MQEVEISVTPIEGTKGGSYKVSIKFRKEEIFWILQKEDCRHIVQTIDNAMW